ncbi:superinfection immunity protein [Actinomadura welshii]|uniref:superinfection immunity protein n=1 Tax=Actinomadura welshii TaxID=3103817 RepID=UPI0003AD31E0|nr:superinfection immunity protein [Actinomadura madurae]
MNAIHSSAFFWLVLIGLLVFLAVLPTLIAVIRGADDIGYIVLVNVICCATVLGWPIALVAAIRWPRRHPPLQRTPSQGPPAPSLHRCQSRIQRGPRA